MKFNRKELIKFQNNGKREEKTLNHICFEIVHDFDNPVSKWIPFMFSYQNVNPDDVFDRSFQLENFTTALCFFDLSACNLDQEQPLDLIKSFEIQ